MEINLLQAFAAELAKSLKTPEDLNQLFRFLKKLTVETALNAELTAHLGHEKHQSQSVLEPFELQIPRDREGYFEPQLIKKNQTRITRMDNQVRMLYAKRMTTQEIVSALKALYDTDVSPTLISKVTDVK